MNKGRHRKKPDPERLKMKSQSGGTQRRAVGLNNRQHPGVSRPLVDDPWMQSGEFVVDSSGMIRIAYLYNYCEDFPDPRVFATAARLAG